MESPKIRPSPIAPLRNPTYRAIWLATLASNFGGLIQAVGAAWLMTSITSSANLVALVQASTTLPIMVFSLASGAIADSFNRRRVMLTAQVFMLAVSVALTVSAHLGLLTPWLLLGFTFLIGCGTALNNPSWQASVGDIVPRADLPAAVALNSVGFNLTRSVGPAIGGAIVAAAGAAAAFAVNAASYLALIFVLLRWNPPVAVSALPREALGPAMGAGLRYVAMSPNIAKVLLRSFLFGLSTIAVLALLPLVARHLVRGGPLTYGVLLGRLRRRRARRRRPRRRLRERLSSEAIVRLAFAGFAACAAVAGAQPQPLDRRRRHARRRAPAGCWRCRSSTSPCSSRPRAGWSAGRSRSTRPRPSAAWRSAAGSGAASPRRTGPPQALLAAAAAMLAAGARRPARCRCRRGPSSTSTPLNRWTEPAVALDLAPAQRADRGLGRVPDPRRRPAGVPGRDAGAPPHPPPRRRAPLDADARPRGPELWLESYQTPTWIEYVRHHQRRTRADAEVFDRIRRPLHRGPGRRGCTGVSCRPPRWRPGAPAPKAPIDHP